MFLTEKSRQTPITETRDVIVAGGGLTGVMAAVAAAREGANVLLTESKSCLGGVATMGLPIQGYCDSNKNQIVKGLAEEFRQRLIAKKGATEDFIYCAMHNPYLVVNPEIVKLVCQEMLADAGISFLLNAPAVDVICEEETIKAILIEGKSGREALVAKQFIDCTGDADLVARSHAPFTIADAHSLQASTLNFILHQVDTETLTRCLHDNPERYDLFHMLPRKQFRDGNKHILVGLSNLVDEAAAEGFSDPLWRYVCYITLVENGTVCINSVHVNDQIGSDTRGLTNIETQGRKQVHSMISFLRSYVPGFEKAILAATAPWAGIRETRLLDGMETITAGDIRAGKRPDNTVALGGYPIDIHSQDTNGLVFEKVPVYGIPYGCMIPRQVQNLLVAGRSISATREAMASTRLMAQCMALGQAAGVAAAAAAVAGITPSQVDIHFLQDRLLKNGACLFSV